jgi:AraC-like DNA-binding protein
MQVQQNKTEMKGDGFLPRLNNIECYHQAGNCLFGIKFKTSPVVFEKKVNFSEYSGTVFSLSYLLQQSVISNIKTAASFEKRVQLLCKHYEEILEQYEGSLQPIQVVTSILAGCLQQNKFNPPVEELAEKYHISTRTLQRYFETATGVSSKKALQVLRIRKAVSHIITAPETFHYGIYGYYDFSHFYKHLKQFLQKDTLLHLQPHLQLLHKLRKKEGR